MLCPIHVHTTYSPLDGVATPEEYFEFCSKQGWPAIAITEHGNMASIPDAYFSSLKYGVKMIAGCEVYYSDYEKDRQNLVKKMQETGQRLSGMSDEEKKKYNRSRHLTILCKNMTGYKNLLRIRSKSYEEAFYRKPRASYEMIEEYKDGLIVLSGCMNGPISYWLLEAIEKQGVFSDDLINSYKKEAIKLAFYYKKLLGNDFYIELQMPGVDNDVPLFQELAKLAKKMDIKCVITNDAHYIREEDHQLQRIMMAIDQNVTVDSDQLFISKSTSGYMKTREELIESFVDGGYGFDEFTVDDFNIACDNTLEIAEKCEQFDPDLSSKLPKIENDNEELRKLSFEGLERIGKKDDQEYIDRLEFELDRIIEKEFSSYFLICRELVKKSIDEGMPAGPRGSAGGSLVCYLIQIHDIDPIVWELSFDRFLSSSRGGYLLQATMDGDELE